MIKTKKISVIIPVLNEANYITDLIDKIEGQLKEINYTNFSITFIDDGSSDDTLLILKTISEYKPTIGYISLSRNFGHQNALKAGLDMVEGDCIISMDGDMQHPPQVLAQLIEKWEEGYDIVYTLRLQERGTNSFKQYTSKWFYCLINFLSDVKLEQGVADFRLLDRKVVEVMKNLPESDLFIRGLVKWLGYKQIGIEYVPNERQFGYSKYNLKRMIRLGIHGITSFSIRPLYLATYLGFFFSATSVLYLPYVLFSYWRGHVISGWGSLIMTVVFFGGLQLCILGIIGIYVGRTFMQVKKRPNYIVKESKLG